MAHARRYVVLCLCAVVGGGVGAGCTKVFRGKAVQPNPLRNSVETLRVSEPITIVTSDMELELPRQMHAGGGSIMTKQRYPLKNRASFTVVSRDRLRFHVQIEHKWREYADLHSWSAFIETSKGQRFVPEGLESGEPHLLVYMWDWEKRSVHRQYGQIGEIVYIRDDGWKDRQPLGSLAVFQGRGDYVFYARDLFTPDVNWIRLVVRRGSTSFSFFWTFSDEPADVLARPDQVTARSQ